MRIHSRSNVLVSFIIPIQNREQTICYCLDSILCQAFVCNYEIIVVDDASTDNTPTIIQKIADRSTNQRLADWDFSTEFPETSALFSSITTQEELEIRTRIKAFFLNSNVGAAAARNVGINNAIGKYIWFVDSDDFISKDALSILQPILSKNNFDILKFDKCSLNSDRPPCSYKLSSTEVVPKTTYIEDISGLLFVLGHGAVWSSIFNREFIGGTRFNSSFTYSEDSLFTWETVLRAHNIAYLSYPLYGYMRTPGSLTSAKPFVRFECYLRVIEKYISAICSSCRTTEEKNILVKECEKRVYTHAFCTYGFNEMTMEMWRFWYKVYKNVMVDNVLRPKYKRVISRLLYTIHCNKLFEMVFTQFYGKHVNRLGSRQQ